MREEIELGRMMKIRVIKMEVIRRMGKDDTPLRKRKGNAVNKDKKRSI